MPKRSIRVQHVENHPQLRGDFSLLLLPMHNNRVLPIWKCVTEQAAGQMNIWT